MPATFPSNLSSPSSDPKEKNRGDEEWSTDNNTFFYTPGHWATSHFRCVGHGKIFNLLVRLKCLFRVDWTSKYHENETVPRLLRDRNDYKGVGSVWVVSAVRRRDLMNHAEDICKREKKNTVSWLHPVEFRQLKTLLCIWGHSLTNTLCTNYFLLK